MFKHRSVRIALPMVAAAVVIFAPGAGADPRAAEPPGLPVVEAAPLPEIPTVGAAGQSDVPRALPAGDVSEAGLQVKTILAARAVSAAFPQITNMIGVRPDSRPWHPNGLAVDIMIPNAYSPEGIALGDEILAFAMANADRFGVQDVIWQGVYHTPAGPRGSNYGHFDHVHITTVGGGYPTGGEEFLRDGV
jgi:hypothetical protein